MKRNILATALISCALVMMPAAANATEMCVVDTIHHEAIEEVSHQEYRYSKTTPGSEATMRTEYRFQSRVWIEKKQEFKDVENYKFVDGGTTRVNGQTVGGHWVSAPGTGYNHIPSVIINIVWGEDGVPDQYLGTGSVNLSQYGGPNVTVKYKAYAEDFSGWSEWGPWSAWSTTNPGPSNDTRNVESKQVSNNDATPDVTVYYVEDGEPTPDLTDANWTTVTPTSEGWTLVDERHVVTQQARKAYDEYVYGECAPVKPEPRPYSAQGETFTCEAWTYWTEDGFYDLTFDEVTGEWVENLEPVVTTATSQLTPTNEAERLARGCTPEPKPELEPEELAETGLTPVASHVLVGGLLALVAGASLVTYRLTRKESQ